MIVLTMKNKNTTIRSRYILQALLHIVVKLSYLAASTEPEINSTDYSA